jgi:hypothetical protein
MPIPASQLEIWSHQGAITTSSAAYNSIRAALSPLVASRGVEIFLQGSYGNSTNIYGDSDVDVVVLYGNAFHSDTSALTPTQQQLHAAMFPNSIYQWQNLRDEVLTALRSYYGSNAVRLGTKAIKVETGRGGRPSDVIPAFQFRRYATFVNQNNLTAHWGVQFFDSSNNPIVNYPKYHIERGEAKNQVARTSGQYKATIRIFKNFRNYLVDHGLLADGIAPSYFIECALHNVPDNLFVGAFVDTVPAILDYLLNTPCTGFYCQNGVLPLIGNSSTQWPAVNFAAFVVAAKTKWNNW